MNNKKKPFNKKKVYVGFAADILHEGHINILKVAKSYGHVTVGLLTDTAISQYKKLPHLTYNQRKVVLQNIKYVDQLVPQNTLDYSSNLNKLKPNFVIHGDDPFKKMEMALLFLSAYIVIMISGPGKISVDHFKSR